MPACLGPGCLAAPSIEIGLELACVGHIAYGIARRLERDPGRAVAVRLRRGFSPPSLHPELHLDLDLAAVEAPARPRPGVPARIAVAHLRPGDLVVALDLGDGRAVDNRSGPIRVANVVRRDRDHYDVDLDGRGTFRLGGGHIVEVAQP